MVSALARQKIRQVKSGIRGQDANERGERTGNRAQYKLSGDENVIILRLEACQQEGIRFLSTGGALNAQDAGFRKPALHCLFGCFGPETGRRETISSARRTVCGRGFPLSAMGAQENRFCFMKSPAQSARGAAHCLSAVPAEQNRGVSFPVQK